MTEHFSTTELEAYFDEALPSEQMARVEAALRDQPQLAEQLATIAGQRDAGLHSLGAIWRRHRLTCPPREQLGSYQLGVLEAGLANYIRFHLETIGCRTCTASLEDLCQQQATDAAAASESRRSKYFQSSAGYLTPDK